MTINRNNYQAYVLDYYEGTLDAEMKHELLRFLDQHPELKSAFENFELIRLDIPSLPFGEKSALKKNVLTVRNYQSAFVAHHEGDLNEAAEKELIRFVGVHPELEPELQLFGSLKLAPDESVRMKDKHVLKRKRKIIVLFPKAGQVAVAAGLALFVIFYFLLRPKQEQHIAHSSFPAPVPQQKILPASPLASAHKRQPLQHRTVQVHENAVAAPATHILPLRKNSIPEQVILADDPNRLKNSPALSDTTGAAHPEPVAEAKNPVKNPKADLVQLQRIFSNDELQELGVVSHPPANGTSAWKLASMAADKLGEATGTEISLRKESQPDQTSFAFAVGKFSVSHVASR